MSALAIAAGVAVLAGAALQSAVGFGFALVCAPLVLAATSPEEAIGLLVLLGVEVNLLTLFTERRRPRPMASDALAVVTFAVPGMVAGVAVLRSVDATTLQIIVTAVVFAGLITQYLAARRRPDEPSDAPRWASSAAGLAAGALTTSTSTAGPPLVLLMLGRRADPVRIRDTLTVCFLALGTIGFGVLMATGTTAAVPDPAALAALAAVVAVGHVAGRPVFARLAHGHYESVLTGVLTASAIGGLAATLL